MSKSGSVLTKKSPQPPLPPVVIENMSWPSWTKFDFPSHDKWVSCLEDWGKEYGFRSFSVSDSKKNKDQRTSKLFKFTVYNLSCRLCRGDEKKTACSGSDTNSMATKLM